MHIYCYKAGVTQAPEAHLQAWHAPCIHRRGKEGKERAEWSKKWEHNIGWYFGMGCPVWL